MRNQNDPKNVRSVWQNMLKASKRAGDTAVLQLQTRAKQSSPDNTPVEEYLRKPRLFYARHGIQRAVIKAPLAKFRSTIEATPVTKRKTPSSRKQNTFDFFSYSRKREKSLNERRKSF